MQPSILIILALILVVATVAAFWLSFTKTPQSHADVNVLKVLFTHQPHHIKQLSGGLLVNTMTIEDVQRLLDVEDFVLDANDSAITDCSIPDKNLTGSCSAWTYLRNDLMPTIFNTPKLVDPNRSDGSGASQVSSTPPLIGIILNPALAWSLISSMAVVNASTNERNCGQYYLADSKTVNVKCTEADGGVGHDTNVIFRGPLLSSELCQNNCDDKDEYCKYQNAGGTIAISKLGNSTLGNWGCQDCSGPFPDNGVQGFMAGCSQSSLPFLCSLDDGSKTEGIVDPHAWAPYSKRNGYAKAHIGSKGEGMQNLFQTQSGLADTWTIGSNQCKFKRDDWDAWVDAIKLYYKTTWENYDPATKTLKAEYEATFGKNYLMSCPRYVHSFFENEVNLYLNPKSDEKKYQELAEKQSQILRNSIVGFFSIGKTCRQQLQSLEGSTCSFDGTTYTGVDDRCDAWFCGKDASQECKDTSVQTEDADLRKAATLAKELTMRFNAKYRVWNDKRQAGLFKYVGSNSTFIDPKYLEVLAKGDHIPLAEVFVMA